MASLRLLLLAGAATAAIAPAAAQVSDAPATAPAAPAGDPASTPAADPAAAPDAAAAASSQSAESQIVVTGTRIARPNLAAPNPITTFNAAAIQDSGNTNLTNFLERVPALTGSRDYTQTSGANAVSFQPFGAAGLNELNLRNLGTNRTLVLVDGRRHVAGSVDSAAVDINSIPTDLVDRVDVLTGGASAIYGADGVSGVVNFILKRDFQGLSARTQFGISSRGDAASRFASVVAGRNFADGRANLTLAYEYEADDPLQNDDRDYLQQGRRQYLVNNDAGVGNPPTSQILAGNLRYPQESPFGAVDIDGDGNADYNGFGQPYRHSVPDSSGFGAGDGDDTPVAGFYSGDLAPRIRRHDVNLLGRYDVSDALKLSVEGKFVQVDARTFDYYQGFYGQYFGVPTTLDNPFIPAPILAAAEQEGVNQIYVTRDNTDYGRHGEDDRRRTWRGVFDVSGRISDHAHYDAYYEYGETDVRITKLNEDLFDRYVAALDAVRDPATGQIVCRSSIDPTAASATGARSFTPGPGSGCIPVSLFGQGTTSQAALGFFQVNDVDHARVTQQVADASMSGDFGALFRLPGGPLAFSLGGEYRREGSRFEPSAYLQEGVFDSFTEPTTVTPSGGHFDVGEGFAELNAPVFQHQRFAETLSLGAAYRYSRYSTIGSTSTWQLNGVYAPVADIRFRGSYGKAVRAPNIQELFQPTTGTSQFVVDPCTPAEIGHGTQYRAANCAALLASLGATINDGLQTGNNIAGTVSGNPDLRPESARTWTAGVVLRPRFLPGLTASLDWYDIKLRNAINTAGSGDLPNLCVDQPTLDNPFCADVTRQQGTGRVIGFVTRPENVADFRTAGADLDVDYLIRTARFGSIDLRLVGGYLHKLQFIALPDAPTTDNVDQFGQPKWTFDFSPTWTVGPLTLNYNLRWFDRTRTQAKLITDADPNFAPPGQLRYHELWQHDVQAELRVKNGLAVYGGVQNIADQKPDPGNSINAPISALGRYLYVGAKLALGRR